MQSCHSILVTGVEKHGCLVASGQRKVYVGDYFVLCVQNLASGVLALSVGNVWQRGNGQSLSRQYTST